MAMEENYVDSLSTDYKGQHTIKEFPLAQFFRYNEKHLQEIDKRSIYYEKNHILPGFLLWSKMGQDFIWTLKNDRYKSVDSSYFNEDYFKNRKIYEIGHDEYLEFSELYAQAYHPYDGMYSRYIDNKIEYILSQCDLTQEEIDAHGIEIVSALTGLLQHSNQDFDEEGKRKIEETLEKAIDSARRQLENGEKEQQGIRKDLFMALQGFDEQSMGNEAFEDIKKMLDGFRDECLADYALEFAALIEEQGIDLDSVQEAGETFEKEMQQEMSIGR